MDKKALQNNSSLVDVIKHHAHLTPQKVCCTFLNREAEEALTYKDLDAHARAIAAAIQAEGLKPQDRVLLLFAPGLPLIKAFIGCLYAGCIAVPIYPPAQEKLLDKALRITQNATPSLALLTSDHLAKFADTEHRFDGIPCLAIDEINPSRANDWSPIKLLGDEVAFLQYTSGSTMHPKGVMVGHNHLLDNVDKIYTHFDMNEDSVLFSWLPPHHDMGLIGCILTPLYGGVPTLMMSPFSFLQNPLSWLKNISKYRVTISGSPNFAYDYCVKRIKEEKKQGLDLSSWLVASNGAEPIRAETMEHFYHAFKEYGFKKEAFYPCYGMAEATLLVTGSTVGKGYKTLTLSKEQFQDHRVHFATEHDQNSYKLVSCGHQIQEVKIVNPDTLILCESDDIGEIWVRSPSVTQGYWQQKEETEHSFGAQIKEDQSSNTYLRTGDLGFIHEEELYVTGRIKDLIILYGKNHYPQDIEYTIMHSDLHTQLGKCAAFVLHDNEEYQLTVMCEVKNRSLGEKEQEELFNALFALVYQAHQLEIHHIVLIPVKSMPHTTSGKIRRTFCRSYLLEKTLPIVASWQLNREE